VAQIRFLLLISRQGKVRLTKWYSPYSQKEKSRIMREVTAMVLSRPPKMCNFIEWKEKKIVYKRWELFASQKFAGGHRRFPPLCPLLSRVNVPTGMQACIL
jgi:hypothetical protein